MMHLEGVLSFLRKVPKRDLGDIAPPAPAAAFVGLVDARRATRTLSL
jgi:hypothetical protein